MVHMLGKDETDDCNQVKIQQNGQTLDNFNVSFQWFKIVMGIILNDNC